MPTKIPAHPNHNCEECRFFEPNGKNGLCRVRPPVLTLNFQFEDGTGGTNKDSTVWPEVSPDDWCGAFQLNHLPEALPAMHALLVKLGAVSHATALTLKKIDKEIDGYVDNLVLETILQALRHADLADCDEGPDGQIIHWAVQKNSDADASTGAETPGQ